MLNKGKKGLLVSTVYILSESSLKPILQDDKRILLLDNIMKQHQYSRDSLLEILHSAQEIFGYLDRRLLVYVAESLHIPPSHVLGVATFYNLFRLKKPGEHTATFCLGTACYVKGVEDITASAEQEFSIKRGETSADGKLSLFVTRCIGACAMAPNVTVDDQTITKATNEAVIDKIKKVLDQLKSNEEVQ